LQNFLLENVHRFFSFKSPVLGINIEINKRFVLISLKIEKIKKMNQQDPELSAKVRKSE
jgi:hypothetical protein